MEVWCLNGSSLGKLFVLSSKGAKLYYIISQKRYIFTLPCHFILDFENIFYLLVLAFQIPEQKHMICT